MKVKVNIETHVKGIGLIETPEENPLLIHYLSPLERAAFRNKFKAFTYSLDGLEIEITPAMCRDLFLNAKRHVTAYRALLLPARQKILMQDPAKKKFLNKPLLQHKLPTRLYHILQSYHCYTMSMVAEKGEYELKRMHHMGKEQLSYLMNLFIKNGCDSLFL